MSKNTVKAIIASLKAEPAKDEPGSGTNIVAESNMQLKEESGYRAANTGLDASIGPVDKYSGLTLLYEVAASASL